MTIPIKILVDSVLLIPQLLPHSSFDPLIIRGKRAAVLVVSENAFDLCQAFRVESVQRVQTDIIKLHGVGAWVVSDIVPHWTVIHAAFPFRGLPVSPPAH